MRRAAILLAVPFILAGCSVSTKANLVPTVESFTPEGGNHVAVITDWKNPTTKGEHDTCSITLLDGGGTQVGNIIDGPANDVAPGATARIRSLIKSDVDSSLVASVTFEVCHSA